MSNAHMSNTCKTILLALAASAPFASGVASAEAASEFKLEVRYDASKSADANYATFQRLARNACVTPGRRPLASVIADRACVADVMDKLVTAVGRVDLAEIHQDRTGRTSAARDFASRG